MDTGNTKFPDTLNHYKVEIEKNLNGKFIDVAIETKTGIVAIEVANIPDHEQVNLEKDLAAGCIAVIIACGNKTVFEQLKSLESEKVHVVMAYELLKIKSLDEILTRLP
jgi:hypothetical protein